jgi:hypothetical protein
MAYITLLPLHKVDPSVSIEPWGFGLAMGNAPGLNIEKRGCSGHTKIKNGQKRLDFENWAC